MARNAEATKSRILDSAQKLVLDRGFSATSVDSIQEAAGISRGTFFYHFPTKDELARSLLERYAELDHALTEDHMARAEKLATDPLQQGLIFLALHEELFAESGLGEAGCLFASYSYEAGLFDDATRAIVLDSVDHWRQILGGKLEAAIQRHGVRDPAADPYVLADMAYGVLQGAFILGRLQSDPNLMVAHIRQFRAFLECMIGGEGAGE